MTKSDKLSEACYNGVTKNDSGTNFGSTSVKFSRVNPVYPSKTRLKIGRLPPDKASRLQDCWRNDFVGLLNGGIIMFGNSNSSTIAKLNTGQSRQRRRWYAAVLVVAFIMMLMPLDAMSLAAVDDPGQVELNKTATPVEGMVNTWDVRLEIEAKDTVTTSDIVLVI
ncbi:MAG: hypothetical protein PHP40_09600, partial [Eubacteriales bacterium]|nr:hypothetical protein [Eubacteriales bacterium]